MTEDKLKVLTASVWTGTIGAQGEVVRSWVDERGVQMATVRVGPDKVVTGKYAGGDG